MLSSQGPSGKSGCHVAGDFARALLVFYSSDYKRSSRAPGRAATALASIPYSKPGRSDTLQEAAQAAGKKMSKAIA